MKKALAVLLVAAAFGATAQTKTTEALDEKYEGLSLYFYKNTLRMLNQDESKEFDELIKDIEKIRFLMIDRKTDSFTQEDYKKLKKAYTTKEEFEEVMTGRVEGNNLDVLIKEKGGSVKGTIIIASNQDNVYVLDILGKVAMDKAGALFKMLDDNSEIAKKIKDAHID